jgi:FkbM family methyltransferase
MKQVAGIWLPDDDTHFADYLERSPRHAGAGTYQLKKIQMALRVMPQDRRGVAVDVGAHVGLWSRVLADNFERVVAFEPVPHIADCFQRNLDGSTNVTLRRLAVSHRAGEIWMTGASENTGNCAIARYPMQPDISVQATTLDQECLGGGSLEGESRVGFIKIDVEGWEVEVLRGGEQMIRACHPIIVIEQKPDNAERYGFKRFAARRLLKSWGAKQLWEKSGDYCLGW